MKFGILRSFWLLGTLLCCRILYKQDWLCRAAIAMGPAFIKIGQFLSARPDIIGNDNARALGILRDQLSHFSFAEVEDIFLHDFGRNLSASYFFIDSTPVASASIAQVYKAVDFNGIELAIKVQRPGVDKKILEDLTLLKKLAGILSYFSSRYRKLKLDKVLELIYQSTKRELDFRLEAAQMVKFSEHNSYVEVPTVCWARTSRRVLTMTWISGVGMDKAKVEPTATRYLMVDFLYRSIRLGYFHADMHAGNILIRSDGRVGLVDFGKIGYLSETERYYIAEVFGGLADRDYERVSAAHFDVGFLHNETHERRTDFTNACRAIGEAMVGRPTTQVSVSRLLSHMLDIANDFGMEARGAVMLFQKNLLLLEGTLQSLMGDFNLWQYLEALPRMNSVSRQLLKQSIVRGRQAQTICKLASNANNLLQKSASDTRSSFIKHPALIICVIFVAICLGRYTALYNLDTVTPHFK